MCSMLENASSRLKCVCDSRLKLPTAAVVIPTMMSSESLKAEPTARSTIVFQRTIAYKATESRTPDIIADSGEGASECASGSHMCIGASPALVPKPTSRNTNASRATCGCSAVAAARNDVQCSATLMSAPVVAKSTYASTVPVKASAMPTDPMRRYFQEASTDAFVRRSGMSSADVTVVASMATHITPRLPVLTATSIVKANRLAHSRNVRGSPPGTL